MAARFATEKGVEVLLSALGNIIIEYPKTEVWFAGPYKNILGEEHYIKRLMPIIKYYQDKGNWKFLGLLSPKEMASFYSNLDILAIPSLNSTEAFGLVQIEAMMNGVPCIASNLPGVRQPVVRHGMGEVVPIGNYKELARAVSKITEHKDKYTKGYQRIKGQYTPAFVAEEYLNLYREINKEINPYSEL